MSDNQSRTTSAVTREFFKVLRASGVSQQTLADKAGVHVNNLGRWRRGLSSPSIVNLEAALAVIGFQISIQPIETPDPEKERPQ